MILGVWDLIFLRIMWMCLNMSLLSLCSSIWPFSHLTFCIHISFTIHAGMLHFEWGIILIFDFWAVSSMSLPCTFCHSFCNTRDQSWAEQNKMGAFLCVGKGSREPSVFLEMKYFGAKESDSPPLIFVGKGNYKCQVLCAVDMLIVTPSL